MANTVVDKLFQEFQDLTTYLDKVAETSFRVSVDANFRKSLLLAVASYFENRITEELRTFISEIAAENELVVEFARNKAISRQYHTYFDWGKDKPGKNANAFYGLFGDAFKKFMLEDKSLNEAVEAFIGLGFDRNRLVHQDYANFALEKTAEEIYKDYQKALTFVDAIPKKLREYSTKPKTTSGSGIQKGSDQHDRHT